METFGKLMLVVMVFSTAVFGSLLVESEAISLCNISEDGLLACKPSVSEPNPVDPSQECCSALSGADLTCLCSYKNSMLLPSMGIDPELAMQLPAKCNIPPPNEC